jgi:hypothetical protein
MKSTGSRVENKARALLFSTHAKASKKESTRFPNGPFKDRAKCPPAFQCRHYRSYEDDDLEFRSRLFMLLVTPALPTRTFSTTSANHVNISTCVSCSSVDLHTAKWVSDLDCQKRASTRLGFAVGCFTPLACPKSLRPFPARPGFRTSVQSSTILTNIQAH